MPAEPRHPTWCDLDRCSWLGGGEHQSEVTYVRLGASKRSQPVVLVAAVVADLRRRPMVRIHMIGPDCTVELTRDGAHQLAVALAAVVAKVTPVPPIPHQVEGSKIGRRHTL